MSSVPPRLNKNAMSESYKLVQEALKLPMENRIQTLKAQGEDSASLLMKMIFDARLSLELRWRAITVMPYLDKNRGLSAVDSALGSSEWYLRNAAVVALPGFDRQYAVEKSANLISDPALVVRTAAVQNLLRLNAREKTDLLWKKLNSPENFHKGESLWVRRHIAKALAELSTRGAEPQFVAMLNDRDPRLYPFAIRGLERLTGKKISRGKSPVHEQREKWLAWAKETALF